MRAYVERTALVKAPLEKVAAIVRDLERWPEWNGNAWRCHWLSGPPWTEGSSFAETVRAGPFRVIFQARVLAAKDSAFLWEGRFWGVRGRHGWRLERETGSTRVTDHEEFDGLLVPLMRLLGLVRYTGRLFEDALRRLKQRAEGGGDDPSLKARA